MYRKYYIRIALTALIAACILPGCGKKNETASVETAEEKEEKAIPTEQDAKNYVQAMFDLTCHGDYDHSDIELSEEDAKKLLGEKDAIVDEMISAISMGQDVDDEVRAGFHSYMEDAYNNARYTVKEAESAEDGGYDVKVTVKPLILFDGIQEDLYERVTDAGISDISEEEQGNTYAKAVLEILTERESDPQYEEAQEIVIHYGAVDGNYESFGKLGETRIGEYLFSMRGL